MAPVDPNDAGPSDKGKAKFNWKNGPPSCKECVRLKLKVRFASSSPRRTAPHPLPGVPTRSPIQPILTPVFALLAMY